MRSRVNLITIITVTALLATTLYFLYTNKNSKEPIMNLIPASVSSSALFETYYPSKLPKGFELKQNSFNFSQDILTFTAINKSNGDKITFSEQMKPTNFDYETLNRSIKDPKKISVMPLESIFGTNKYTNKNMLYSISNNSLIIVTSNSMISEQDWLLIAKNLSK